MGLIENIKDYFSKKASKAATGDAPKGICPNCWGAQEWDGEYYKFMKGQNQNPDKETYDNFIKKVARMLDEITINKNNYTCETCKMNYKEVD